MRYPLAALVFAISTTVAGLESAQHVWTRLRVRPQPRISIRARLRWATRRMGPQLCLRQTS
jgi:hypothetical protein